MVLFSKADLMTMFLEDKDRKYNMDKMDKNKSDGILFSIQFPNILANIFSLLSQISNFNLGSIYINYDKFFNAQKRRS